MPTNANDAQHLLRTECKTKRLGISRTKCPEMSLLPPEIHAALATLLQNLSSADNAIRTHAEEGLNNEWFNKRPDVLLVGLVEQIQQSQDTSVRVSCNLLRTQLRNAKTGILDTVLCRNPVPPNVNKNKAVNWRRPGVERAIYALTATTESRHKAEVAGMSTRGEAAGC